MGQSAWISNFDKSLHAINLFVSGNWLHYWDIYLSYVHGSVNISRTSLVAQYGNFIVALTTVIYYMSSDTD